MGVRQRAVSALPTLIRTLRKEPLKPQNHVNPLPSLRRSFSLYDQINLIDQVPEDQLRFQGYNDTGFTVNGVEYEGSLLCVGNLLMSWKPQKFSEITAESLSLFQLVRPIPEILIIGCGRNIQHVDPELRQFVRSTGMKLEAVDSVVGTGEDMGPIKHVFKILKGMDLKMEIFLPRNAASTYNILNEEGRIVAAALLPFGVSS